MVEKKADLSLNWIQKELDVLTEKKIRGWGVLQGQVENLSLYWTVTENLPFKRFRFLKLLELKQWKSFVIIGRNFKTKMALNE